MVRSMFKLSISQPLKEIISLIFFMGMDFESSVLTQYSTPRQTKLFIQRVMAVCHRWNVITKWNPRFWLTELNLYLYTFNHDDPLLHYHRVKSISRFKQALHSAQ